MTDTGMGADAPATASRSSRRNRNLAIVGVLALVLVAGAVIVGVTSTGSRSGATYTDGVACKDGGTCVLGDIGPGGGTVFYVAAADFTCATGTCRYLEVAPRGWKSGVAGEADPQLRWRLGTTSGGSDTGQNVAKAYRGGQKTDWHMPVLDELKFLYAQRSLPGVSTLAGQYWSDTPGSVSGNAMYINFGSTSATPVVAQTSPTYFYYVRPVRAF